MSSKNNEYMKLLGMGAGIGLAGGILSMVSNELFSVPLGYSSLNIKNAVKASAASAVSSILVFLGVEKVVELKKGN